MLHDRGRRATGPSICAPVLTPHSPMPERPIRTSLRVVHSRKPAGLCNTASEIAEMGIGVPVDLGDWWEDLRRWGTF